MRLQDIVHYESLTIRTAVSPQESSILQLPTHTASAPRSLGLRVVVDPEAAAYQFRCEVDGGTVEQSKGNRVDEDIGWLNCWMCEMTEKKGRRCYTQ